MSELDLPYYKRLKNPDSSAHLIIIDNPIINEENQHIIEYTKHHTERRQEIVEALRSTLSPQLYPYALDLFAGNGPIAEILVDEGWDPSKITCVDLFKPSRNLVPNAERVNWNIGILANCLSGNYELPIEVEKYKGKFDLAMMVQSHHDMQSLINLGDFFLKPKGIAFLDYNYLPDELILSGKWKKLEKFPFFEKQF